MTERHHHITDRLSDYLDGGLDAAGRGEVEAHVARCAECALALDELRRVARRARALRDGGRAAATPPPAVWEAVARHVEGRGVAPTLPASLAGAEPTPLVVRRVRRQLAFSLPQLIAAGLTLMALSAGGGYLASRASGGAAAPADSAALASADDTARDEPAAAAGGETTFAAAPKQRADGGHAAGRAAGRAPADPVVTPVALPWDEYDAATEDLERVLSEGRGRLRPETIRAIEQSVASIDRAIAQARQALAKDPANEYLSRHVAENMKRKLELLRQAAAIVGRQS